MDLFAVRNDTEPPDDACKGEAILAPGNKDIFVQFVISAGLGISAFLAFCIIRPRWTSLYAARRRHGDPKIHLPALPDGFVAWIPALFRVTGDQVLAAAGLDAFVFLSFFQMSIRLFATMFFFSVVVLLPIHQRFDRKVPPGRTNSIHHVAQISMQPHLAEGPITSLKGNNDDKSWDWDYLWAYFAFTWFFSALTMYFLDLETTKIIKIRQDYLGTQSTVTDRTFRLMGIPKDLRSEEQIREFVENLEIGKVHSVTLCRDWAELDHLVGQRKGVLQQLEETWTAYLSQRPVKKARTAGQPALDVAADDEGPANDIEDQHQEHQSLLGTNESLRELVTERKRPTIRIHYGFLNMRSRATDALDYYEEKLRRLDEKIIALRKQEFTPTNMAFVTMDSIAACQMAMQAVIDPRPGQLLSKPAPSPTDVVWKNTYTPWYTRRVRAWIITISITILSIIWLAPVAFLAQLVSICNIANLSGAVADALDRHEVLKALVRTGLPTLLVSLLNVLVPYLYDYLSNHQGMISQGDVELSVVSKNFFFTFFNIFVVYAVSGSAALFNFWTIIRDSFSDTQIIATKLAGAIEELSSFYLSLIMLQGIGLFPFKLLQFGSVAMYPISRMGAKTPRDFARLVEPNFFNYGFYLPTALLVFILCLVYSVLPGSYLVLLLGLCYFGLGYVTYKYQLLYSMDQSQHATGKAWPMICTRIILGLVMFQVTMIGILLLRKMFFAAALIGPLLIVTFWYLSHFNRRFTPLTEFIALRSIKRRSDPAPVSNPDEDTAPHEDQARLVRRMSTIDEDREKGMLFINPSLIVPLEQPWVYHDRPRTIEPQGSLDGEGMGRPAVPDANLAGASEGTAASGGNGNLSHSSSFSWGDTHIWRDNGGNNV